MFTSTWFDFAHQPSLGDRLIFCLGGGGKCGAAAFSSTPVFPPNPEAERSRGHFDLLASYRKI